MNRMKELAERYEQKAQKWIIVYRICQGLILFNALLFGLYLGTPIKGPFELIFGSSAYNLWISIAVCTAVTFLLSTAFHRCHGFRDLANRAMGVAPDSPNKPE